MSAARSGSRVIQIPFFFSFLQASNDLPSSHETAQSRNAHTLSAARGSPQDPWTCRPVLRELPRRGPPCPTRPVKLLVPLPSTAGCARTLRVLLLRLRLGRRIPNPPVPGLVSF
eukprot:765700-Hanusia_phi.AAC.5